MDILRSGFRGAIKAPSGGGDPLAGLSGYTAAWGLYESSGSRVVTIGDGPTLVEYGGTVGSDTSLHAGKLAANFDTSGKILRAAVADCGDINPGAGDISVSLWIYIPSAANGEPSFVVYGGAPYNTNVLGCTIFKSGTTRRMSFYIKSGGFCSKVVEAGLAYTDDAFNHFAFTVNRATDTAYYYVNGDKSAETCDLDAASIGQLTPASDGLNVGGQYDGANDSNGRANDLIIWKGGVWSDADIATLWNSGSGIDLDP